MAVFFAFHLVGYPQIHGRQLRESRQRRCVHYQNVGDPQRSSSPGVGAGVSAVLNFFLSYQLGNSCCRIGNAVHGCAAVVGKPERARQTQATSPICANDGQAKMKSIRTIYSMAELITSCAVLVSQDRVAVASAVRTESFMMAGGRACDMALDRACRFRNSHGEGTDSH